MISSGRSGPGFRSYRALREDEEAVITAHPRDIDKVPDIDPENQPGKSIIRKKTKRPKYANLALAHLLIGESARW